MRGFVELKAAGVAALAEANDMTVVVDGRAVGDAGLVADQLELPVYTHVADAVGVGGAVRTPTRVVDQIVGAPGHALVVHHVVENEVVGAGGNAGAPGGVVQEQAVEAGRAVGTLQRASCAVGSGVAGVTGSAVEVGVVGTGRDAGAVGRDVVEGELGSGETAGADVGLVLALEAVCVAGQVDIGVLVLIGVGRAGVDAGGGGLVVVLPRQAGRLAAIVPVVTGVAVADSPRAEPVLAAPVRADLPRLLAETNVIGALKVPVQTGDRLLGPGLVCGVIGAGHDISTHCEVDPVV